MTDICVDIHTTAPIELTQLKRKFTENVRFIIDYDASTLRGKVLLTYLANLNIQSKIQITDPTLRQDLLLEYLKSPSLVRVPELEHTAMQILLAIMGQPNELDFDPTELIREHADVFVLWLTRLASLMVFTLHCHPSTEGLVKEFPEDDNNSLMGINFVHLIDHPDFPLLLSSFDEQDLTWNKMFFNEYVFAGNNLFHYFSSRNNPLFMGLLVMESPDPTVAIELLDTVARDVQKINEVLEHVPSV